jgi:NAD+--asparagine ADP-ribosyltransferase
MKGWAGTLLLGVLISLVGWGVAGIWSYYNNRTSIEEVILLDIVYRSHDIQEIQEACNKFIETQINEKKVINNCIRYSKDEVDIYKLMLPDMAKYLSKKHINKIMKYYNALYEYNFLMDGLSQEMRYLKEKQIVMKPEDLTYFKDKNDRINKIVKIIAQKYESIDDLPDDYRGMVSPETLIK